MTWKRVATAVVLIPFVVGLVIAASTSWVTIAVTLVVLLAMFEFFALGDAIGHRAYRFWTASCAVLMVFSQYLAAMDEAHSLGNGLTLHRVISRFVVSTPSVADVFFIFLFVLTVLTLATPRTWVEALPAAAVSSRAFFL